MTEEAWDSKINGVLMEFGITKEPFQENAAELLESALTDYNGLAKQNSKMIAQFFREAKPVSKSGVWCCPACGKRIQYNHSFCHWCGKKVGWKDK